MTKNQEVEAQQGLDFYISYAGQDRLWAEWVGWQSEHAGYTCVLDWLPGDNIVLAREDALRRADRVLALCSAAYFGGGFTKQDWTTVMADQHGESGRLVPIWIEDLEGKQLPVLVRSVQPIKLFGLPEGEAKQRLLSGLAGDPGPGGTPEFPGSAILPESDQEETSRPRLPGMNQPSVWLVPPRNPGFTGRDSLLVDVRQTLLNAATGMVVLQGPGGVGKTQLSIEYAYRFASDYETVWVIDAEQPELVTNQLAELSVALGTATSVTDAETAATAAVRALRDQQRWLLVFDNVEDADHLTGFLPDRHGHMLVTTRAGMWQEISDLITVEEFSRAESTALLTSRVAALPQSDADFLAEALGDLPLALAQAAGVLQSGLPATEFQRLLTSQATQVLSQGKPRSYTTSLAAATLVALEKLGTTNDKAANLLCLCGYLAPESIPAAWFYNSTAFNNTPSAAQIGVLPDGGLEVSQVFGRIRDIGLGRVDQNGLRLHRLTQAIIRDHTVNQQAAYRGRVVAVLSAAAPASSDDPASWPTWTRIIPHLLLAISDNAHDSLRPLACAAARYLLHSGQAKAALAMARRLRQIWAAELGPDDIDTLNAAQYLAHAMLDSGDYTRAFELQQETLERRRRVLGEDHPDTLNSANDLANTLNSLGRSAEALALHQDTYDRRRRVLGEDHPDTLNSAGNLASARSSLGRYKEALALHQDTYDRRRRVLGEDHPDTLNSGGNLASALGSLGRSAEALALHQDTYDRRRRVLGEDHPDSLSSAGNLATARSSLGRYQEALALHQDTYDRRRRVLGEDHPDTLTSASNLATARSSLGRYQEALALHQDTYDRRRRVLGEDHPDTLTSAGNLATARSSLGRSKEALALHQDTYDRRRRVLGEDHPDTLTSGSNLATARSNLRRYEEALALHQDTYDRYRRVLGEDHPDTLNSGSNLASTLYASGRRTEALALNQDIYNRRRRVLGKDHPDTLNSARNLAANLEGLGQRKAAMSVRGQKPKKRKKR